MGYNFYQRIRYNGIYYYNCNDFNCSITAMTLYFLVGVLFFILWNTTLAFIAHKKTYLYSI